MKLESESRVSGTLSPQGAIALQLLRTYLSPVTHVHCTFINTVNN